MSELSSIGKIKQALDLAVKAETGCTLTHFEAIELLGHIKALEEDYCLTNETIKPDGNLGISFNEFMEKSQALYDEMKKRAEAAEKERDEWRRLSAENKFAGMEWMERADGYLARAEAAEAKVKELEAASRWIPVSERLPEKDTMEQWEMYECKLNRYGEILIAPLWFVCGNWYCHYNQFCYDEFVTDWRPIQPPRPEEGIRHG